MAKKDSRHNMNRVSVERGPLVSDNILSTISYLITNYLLGDWDDA